MTETAVPVHPIQNRIRYPNGGEAPQCLTLRAYEVYSHVYSPQPAMITGGCRGGFALGELMALLYAHSFPKAEWGERLEEGLRGLKI